MDELQQWEPYYGFVSLGLLVLYVVCSETVRTGSGKDLKRTASDKGSSSLTVGFWIASFTIPPIVGVLLPAKKPLSPAVVLALLLLQAFGIVLRWWSMSVLGAFFSRTLKVVDEQRVIQHGPYRWVRHPGYLANLFSFVPYTVVTSAHWLVGLGTLAVFGIIYRYRMDAEEAMLSSSPQLGAAYRSYMSRSWRLIPLLY